MDDQLLAELYGIDPNDGYETDDSMIKEAQAELVEAVADEAGIDLNEMDDDELEKFASYVLSADSHEEDYIEDDYIEDDMYAQADEMGRVMAHAYADEQMKIASLMEEEAMLDDVYDDIADSWEMAKIAAGNFAGYGGNDNFTMKGRLARGGKVGEDFSSLTNRQKMQIARKRLGKTGKDKNTLSDMGIRKRDYLRALAGRGTGYYDLSTASDVGADLRKIKDSMSEKEYKSLMKEVRQARRAKGTYGSRSSNAISNARKNVMRNRGLVSRQVAKARAAGGGYGGYTADLVAAAQDARRGLMLRGGLKAGATAAGLGALGYGAYRASQR
jgi:hypothetical protein